MTTSEVLIRALKTFFQGFLGALAVSLPENDISNLDIVKSILVGAVAAGISAVMNMFLNYISFIKKTDE